MTLSRDMPRGARAGCPHPPSTHAVVFTRSNHHRPSVTIDVPGLRISSNSVRAYGEFSSKLPSLLQRNSPRKPHLYRPLKSAALPLLQKFPAETESRIRGPRRRGRGRGHLWRRGRGRRPRGWRTSRRRIRSWGARSAPPRMGAPGGWTAPPLAATPRGIEVTPKKIPARASSKDRSPGELLVGGRRTLNGGSGWLTTPQDVGLARQHVSFAALTWA
jgi:hypothetical protein